MQFLPFLCEKQDICSMLWGIKASGPLLRMEASYFVDTFLTGKILRLPCRHCKELSASTCSKCDILKSIDNKQCVVLLLLDLSAVFDTVNHKILLHRLRSRFVVNKFKSKLKTFLFKRVYELS